MANLNTIVFSSLMLVLVGCGIHQPVVISEGLQHKGVDIEQPEAKIFLEGTVDLVDETSLDLVALKDKPIVLMFAGFLCSTCAEEVELLRNSLNDQNAGPSNIHFVSVVVGEDLDTALWWKEGRKVPWTVGYDLNLELFTKYCGNSQTPCTLIQTPNEGIVYKHVGATGIETLQSYTGPWEQL